MFSKAKLKRFNEEVGCAPPPTRYNVTTEGKATGLYLERIDRFKVIKDVTPGPNAYCGIDVGPVRTPRKKGPLSTTKLNSSLTSTNSSSSQKEFLSPPTAFSRSRSVKSTRVLFGKQMELVEQLKKMTEEKANMKITIAELEKKIVEFQILEAKVSNSVRKMCESATQVNFDDRDIGSNQNDEDNSCKDNEEATTNSLVISVDDYQLMKEEIEHLIFLRDNLEESILQKDDVIADLQVQVDLIVSDHQKTSEYFNFEVSKLSYQLNQVNEDKKHSEIRVSEMVYKFESLIQLQHQERRINKENIAQRDIEIELLNDSVSTLNTKISEYEHAVALRLSQISSLEITVSDLSIATKEKEVMETLFQDELSEKSEQLNNLEESLLTAGIKMDVVVKERDGVNASLKEEKGKMSELLLEVNALKMQLKEKDVVEQFLEKEILARELEISDYIMKTQNLEADLQSIRQMAIDLQQDAELQLNQLFCMKATVSIKDYDIEAKDDLISSLRDEVQKNSSCKDSSGEVSVEKELAHAKQLLQSGQENTSQLEERLIELLAELDDREDDHKKRIVDKDSELEELSVKYSDALLEQETLKRILTLTSEELEKERLVGQATERDLNSIKSELKNKTADYLNLEIAVKELSVKNIHLEDALVCEEEESHLIQEELEKKLEFVEDLLVKAKDENSTIQSSNSGFMSQITQLRIDMTKKCCAVNEMQYCIDTLREEKIQLNSSYIHLDGSLQEKEILLNDLQNEFEQKLKTITELQENLVGKDTLISEKITELESKHLKLSSVTSEKETIQALLSSKIADLEILQQQNQQSQDSLSVKETNYQKSTEMLKEEQENVLVELKYLAEYKDEQICTLERNVNYYETKYESYDDQISNLQISLQEKSAEVERFEKSSNDMNMSVESHQLTVQNLQSQLDKFQEEHLKVSKSLEQKDELFSTLNYTMLQKSDQLHELHKDNKLKQDQIESLELSVSNMEDVLKCNIADKEAETEKSSEKSEMIKQNQDELKSQQVLLKKLQEELKELKKCSKIREHELQIINMSLLEESNSWKQKFDCLEEMIGPFREQLDEYNMERSSLISKNTAAQREVDKLSKDYAKLLGHANHKQKIQHVVKLKEQNNQLKEEVHKLKYELEHAKHVQRKMEKLTGARPKAPDRHYGKDKENKENSSTNSPLRSSNKLHRI